MSETENSRNIHAGGGIYVEGDVQAVGNIHIQFKCGRKVAVSTEDAKRSWAHQATQHTTWEPLPLDQTETRLTACLYQ